MEFENVSISYGKQVILSNLNLNIPSGKITGILGPNGCGKTTMLLAAQGLLPIKGLLWVKGREVGSYNRIELARVMGVVPQIHQLSFPCTVLDMVLTGRAAYISYLPQKKDYQVAHESLELTGIQHLSDKVYTRISGGERQLVMIARALCQEPEIILFDEPTSFLDLR
ncbi:MAG: ABC transporter ATP-binding protein, partial [Candidatus Contubernalis sp.]|nr:ABC transporter ATP-binding protein [Candidatus Contubernalis sp.]